MDSEKEFENNPTIRVESVVRWGDCDAAGITYYVKYFDWFTDGRITLLESIGLPYMDTFHNYGIEIVVIDAFCRYRLSLRPMEKIYVEAAIASLTRTKITFKYRILKEDNSVAAEGSTNHAFVDERGKPFNLAKKCPELWEEIQQKGLL